jgi:hypothetical protein
VCDEVIKKVERFCSNWMQVLLQALLPQDSAVDNTPFVYNSLTMPDGASNRTWTQHVIYLDFILLMLDIVYREAEILYPYIM